MARWPRPDGRTAVVEARRAVNDIDGQPRTAIAIVLAYEWASATRADLTGDPTQDAIDIAVFQELRSGLVTRVLRSLDEVPAEDLPQADPEIDAEDDGGTGAPRRRKAIKMANAYARLSAGFWTDRRKREFESDDDFVRRADGRIHRRRDGTQMRSRGKHQLDAGAFGELRTRLVRIVLHDLVTRG